ncbi:MULTISPECIES: MFS transporter [unclassified Bartonella]|uniref:MFS transporter n=1 Tax=unclassified Bartonella TaxID=2645622 RepID=UPI00099A4379|nr:MULTISPECIES: MFS transporter [unclassified Bartonella]AQX27447.1 putative arabinose efflux permease, MFS family [Bartonella sp. JB15]AQX28728.1 putative arabinose efflux permease, MFS family [Bartonella sp. JB63]
MQRISTLEIFHNSTFRNLWTATLVFNLGSLVQTVGASWMMTLISSSHSMVGLVQSATTLPLVVFSLMAGALADNFNRRHIMLFAQIMMMIISINLVILSYIGLITPWLLLCFTFLIGCGSALYNPSWQATIGDIVNRESISTAVSLNSVGFNLMRSIGPSIGGIIISTLGGISAFFVNALSYIPLISVLFLWKPDYQNNTLPRERFLGSVADGLRYVAMSPNLLNIMIRAFLFCVGAMSVFALLPIVVNDFFRGNALLYGTLLSCFGLGAITGGIINSFVRNHLKPEVIVTSAFVGISFSCFFLAMSRSLFISHFVLFPAGLCWVLALSLFNTSVQLSTPRWVVARALALYQTASYLGMTVGSAIWGALADSYSLTFALNVCAIFLICGALAGIKFKVKEIPQINLEPLDQVREPELSLDLEAQSGPIMIMIDYQINENDLAEFLEIMTRRRHIRLRDGARQWVLLRDLERPEYWTESYHMSTWVDYLRHNRRRTKADIEVNKHLDKLNRISNGIKVHYMIKWQTVPKINEMRLKLSNNQ